MSTPSPSISQQVTTILPISSLRSLLNESPPLKSSSSSSRGAPEVHRFSVSLKRISLQSQKSSSVRMLIVILVMSHRESGEVTDIGPLDGERTAIKAYAIDQICPHANASLVTGDLEDLPVPPYPPISDLPAPSILCPRHEYDFNLETGESRMCFVAARTWACEVVNMTPNDAGSLEEEWLCVRVESQGKDAEMLKWEVGEVNESFAARSRTMS
ncbi:hypothetical protein HDU93_001189 [Gonapodya sp. JEL0774]|nr:hypothetical protein HDU93_001189 [Gonapodya sp. JEL0774]